MKLRLSLLVMLSMTFVTSIASGIDLEAYCLEPYFGAEVQWRQMSLYKGYGDNLFQHDFPEGNLFVGIKANEYLGIELGYEITKKRRRNTALAAGDIATGNEVQILSLYTSQSKFYGPHINLMGFYPLRKEPSPHSRIDLVGSLGLAYLKGSFVSNRVADAFGPLDPTISRTFSRRRSILRLGAGLQNMLSCDVGIRFMINWENTTKLHLINKESFGSIQMVKPKNSVIYSLGLFILY